MRAQESGKDSARLRPVRPVSGGGTLEERQSFDAQALGRLGRGVCWSDMVSRIERYWRDREPAGGSWDADQVA